MTTTTTTSTTTRSQQPFVSSSDHHETNDSIPWDMNSLFWTKSTYKSISNEFHPFHKHDMNVAVHLFTTGLGIYGVLQLATTVLSGMDGAKHVGLAIVALYSLWIALTVPVVTSILHTAFVYLACYVLPPVHSIPIASTSMELTSWQVCLIAIALGYGLQEFSHYIFQEKTYMSTYIDAKPWKLIIHSIYLMPLVIDSVLNRSCFFFSLFVTRNRNINCDVASRKAVDELREWINRTIPVTPETTHVWPHVQDATSGPVLALENDAAILACFRKVFAARHYDIRPVQGMNEIYITAVGAKKEINSDAVFYTPHCDGPYWFTPFASLYRVLVGVTPNTMVRTRFNLQHESENQILDLYRVCGFDYNRELHWIDHVEGAVNTERRSLVKLHFVVYPKGWHWYGSLVASANQAYNTWARGNFLKTLRPSGLYEFALAWWIWLTTWTNYVFEENIGWSNLVYVLATFLLLPKTGFLIATSFRHYGIYMATLAAAARKQQQQPVAHGFIIRDSKLFKTMALFHLAKRLVPIVDIHRDWPILMIAGAGFAITIAATARLGMVRTYFGSELGFVKPKWISGFPYGTVPHPMILGQLVAFAALVMWFQNRIDTETTYLLYAHMACYTTHMVQEMLTSSY